tara:strand:- start:11883 stop:12125 length:243 start_codon:yes stop_codon:yes gene_type:complete
MIMLLGLQHPFMLPMNMRWKQKQHHSTQPWVSALRLLPLELGHLTPLEVTVKPFLISQNLDEALNRATSLSWLDASTLKS